MKDQPIRFGICQWCIPVEGPSGCQYAVELGLKGMGLNFSKPLQEEPLTRKEVQRAYLEASRKWNISFPSLGLNLFGGISMCREGDRGKVLDVMVKAVETAASMRIPLLQLPSFGESEIRSEEDFQNTVICFKFVCSIAKPWGIRVGTENTLSSQENLRLIGETSQENMGIYFDTQNPYAFKGYTAAQMAGELGESIFEVHAKDGIGADCGSALLGKGDSDFVKTAEVLKDRGYKGWILLENNFGSPGLQLSGGEIQQQIRKDIDTLKLVFT